MKTLNVGFRTESFGPFAHLFKKIAREKYDFDLKPQPKFGKGEEAELSILGGDLHFLLGNHYTPIAARANGVHICWLAIPMSEHYYQIATRPEIDSVEQLKGKTVLLPAGRCPAINMILVFRLLGLERHVQFQSLKSEGRTNRYYENFLLSKLKEGSGDAVVVESPLDITAKRMGLRLHPAPELDVIAGPCITTTPAFARKDPALTQDLLRAYVESIHAFKTDKKLVLDILLERGGLFRADDTELVDAWYAHASRRMAAKPFPSASAIEWTKAKAEVDYPDARGVDARQLFELDGLRELEGDGFIDSVWADVKGQR